VGRRAGPPGKVRAAAAISLLSWIAVITCGRFIAYDWFACGKPQSAFINAVEACKASEEGAYSLQASDSTKTMSINLEHIFPAARPWVENLVNVWPTPYVKPNFAFWEVGHVLSLIMLGGATILMNLRLIGVGLTQERPSEIFKNLRAIQTAGLVGILVTGVLIGMANAERLYGSTAFIVKMLALFGGVILTYGASRPTAAAEGRISTAAKAWFALGMAFWLAALAVFTTGGLAPGVLHVITAAACWCCS